MKLNILNAFGVSMLFLVAGLLQGAVAQEQGTTQNELRGLLDPEFDAIDARGLDPVDEFLSEVAIRGLVDDFEEDLAARQLRSRCRRCGRLFSSTARVC
ncbi:hypothetical protein MD484_g3683, partial [Candolleomyces efflorescens]